MLFLQARQCVAVAMATAHPKVTNAILIDLLTDPDGTLMHVGTSARLRCGQAPMGSIILPKSSIPVSWDKE
jgi:hypothetical protein